MERILVARIPQRQITPIYRCGSTPTTDTQGEGLKPSGPRSGPRVTLAPRARFLLAEAPRAWTVHPVRINPWRQHRCAARAVQAPTQERGRRCVRSAREESFRTSLAPPHAQIARRERFQAPPTVPQGAARAAQAPTQERGRRRVRSAREESFRASLALHHAQIIAWRERFQDPRVPQDAPGAPMANFLPPIRLIAQLVPQENTHFPVPGPSLVNPHLMMTTAHAKYLLEQTESHKGSRRMVAMQTAVGLLMLRGAFISRFRSLSPSKIMTT